MCNKCVKQITQDIGDELVENQWMHPEKKPIKRFPNFKKEFIIQK